MKANEAVLNVHISTDLRERTRVVAKRLLRTSTDIARDALAEKVEALEFKHRQEQLAQEAERTAAEAAKKAKREYRSNSLSSLAPVPLSTQARASSAPPSPMQDPMEALYTQLARSILTAGNNKDEVRKRAIAAIAAIRRERPLTSPPDDQILVKLENYVIKLREEGFEPPTRTIDSLIGRVLDVSKLKTSGITE